MSVKNIKKIKILKKFKKNTDMYFFNYININ